jgi:hypothetical protein
LAPGDSVKRGSFGVSEPLELLTTVFALVNRDPFVNVLLEAD